MHLPGRFFPEAVGSQGILELLAQVVPSRVEDQLPLEQRHVAKEREPTGSIRGEPNPDLPTERSIRRSRSGHSLRPRSRVRRVPPESSACRSFQSLPATNKRTSS